MSIVMYVGGVTTMYEGGMTAVWDLTHLLGSAPVVPTPWYHGVRVSEAVELLLVLTLFIGVLVTVHFIQRWIGDY